MIFPPATDGQRPLHPTSMILVDCGHSFTHVVPIIEGQPSEQAIKRFAPRFMQSNPLPKRKSLSFIFFLYYINKKKTGSRWETADGPTTDARLVQKLQHDGPNPAHEPDQRDLLLCLFGFQNGSRSLSVRSVLKTLKEKRKKEKKRCLTLTAYPFCASELANPTFVIQSLNNTSSQITPRPPVRRAM